MPFMHPASIHLRRLAGCDRDSDGCFGKVDGSRRVWVIGQLFGRGARDFRPEVPEERMPARFQQAHHPVADEKKRAELNEAANEQIVSHQILWRG